jgi:hypothetical protein
MNKNYLPWIISGIFVIIVAAILVNDLTVQQNIQQLSAQVSQLAMSLNKTPIAVQPTTPSSGVPAPAASAIGHCPVVAVDKTVNVVTFDGQPTSLITLAPGEVVREAKLSDDCKFIAWNTYQMKILNDGTKDWSLNIYVVGLDGSGYKAVDSKMAGMPGAGSTPDMSGYEVTLGHFFSDRLVIDWSLSGDNSPGPGYYSLGLDGIETYDLSTKQLSSEGGLVAASADGRWVEIKKENDNTMSLVDLETGVVAYTVNVAKGPDLYDYYFSPDGTYLIYAEIPGTATEQGMDCVGASKVFLQKYNGAAWTEPVQTLSSGSGAPYDISGWNDATHALILRSDANNTNSYVLDVATGKLVTVKK